MPTLQTERGIAGKRDRIGRTMPSFAQPDRDAVHENESARLVTGPLRLSARTGRSKGYNFESVDDSDQILSRILSVLWRQCSMGRQFGQWSTFHPLPRPTT
jgi:hypothetical protein